MEIARAIGYQDDEREPRDSGLRNRAARSPTRSTAARRSSCRRRDAYARRVPAVKDTADRRRVRRDLPPSRSSSAAGSSRSCSSNSGSRRSWTRDDREYLLALSARAAQALDRTFQLESALRGRAEAEALQARADRNWPNVRKWSWRCARAKPASAPWRRGPAACTGWPPRCRRRSRSRRLRARSCTMAATCSARPTGKSWRLSDDGSQFETVFSDLSQPGAGRPPRLDRCRARALCRHTRSGPEKPVFVASFDEWQERYSTSAALAADGGYVSSATLPLIVDGAPAGVLAFYFTAPVNFDEEYQALLISVAQHCAQALERARLYEAAQAARAEAETANRLKDEFVSIVSHELRTPLSAMLGWASMLEKGTLDAGRRRNVPIRSIQENATRQVRLVDELLDLSRLTSGRLTL